jgi:glycosyltransferase involved in cell wall biosynthesis
MQHVDADVELLIAGDRPEPGLVGSGAGDDARIRFVGFVGDDALLDLYADAIAVLFVPIDEDFGLVTIEAMSAGKPVITALDSGATSELVWDGDSGFVTDPSPAAIAARIDELLAQPELARRMGERGRARASSVSWETVCATLLDGLAA